MPAIECDTFAGMNFILIRSIYLKKRTIQRDSFYYIEAAQKVLVFIGKF